MEVQKGRRKCMKKERLTVRRDHGITMREGYDFHCEPEEWDLIQEILERLAAYEDCGFEPEEICEWIHPERELPMPGEGCVLVIASGRTPAGVRLQHAYELAEYDEREGWIFEAWPGAEDGLRVDYWMPLPPQPGEGDEDA